MSRGGGSQYQPGGAGIHRNLSTASNSSSRPGGEYLSKQVQALFSCSLRSPLAAPAPSYALLETENTGII